ncbi:transglycosylase SLT domain-containing protein [Pseudarthrobacter sulfonivorans]
MGVDPSLGLAFAMQESTFRQNVTSSAGAIGTMQIMPTSREWASQLVGRQLVSGGSYGKPQFCICHCKSVSANTVLPVCRRFAGHRRVGSFGAFFRNQPPVHADMAANSARQNPRRGDPVPP